MKKRSKRYLRIYKTFLFLLLISFFPLSCGQKTGKPQVQALPELSHLPQIALLPTLYPEMNAKQILPFCRICFQRHGKKVPTEKHILEFNQLLYEKFNHYSGFQVYPKEKIQGQLLFDTKPSDWPPPLVLTQWADEIGVDFLLYSTLFLYEERAGKSYGVEKPATVAFDLHLFRTKDGKLIWSKQYIETQKALTDNVFLFPKFIKRKGKWLSVSELAKEGIDESLKEISVLTSEDQLNP